VSIPSKKSNFHETQFIRVAHTFVSQSAQSNNQRLHNAHKGSFTGLNGIRDAQLRWKNLSQKAKLQRNTALQHHSTTAVFVALNNLLVYAIGSAIGCATESSVNA